MSNVLAGINHLLYVNPSGDLSTWVLAGGLQTKKAAFSAEVIKITNHGSNEWEEVLDGHGTRSMKISGSGVYDDTSNTLTYIQQAFMNENLIGIQFLQTDAGGFTYQGMFKITSLDLDSNYDKEVKWSMSLESSGVVRRVA